MNFRRSAGSQSRKDRDETNMKISEIIRGTDAAAANAQLLARDASGISCDTRTIDLFFAVNPAFAAQAIAAGACAVAANSDARLDEIPPDLILRTGDIRKTMALSAANFFARPAHRMTMLGITGTNGKTTTSFLTASMLRAAGESVGIIGTIGYSYAGKEIPAPNTTPGSIPLQKLLADMLSSGVTSAVMEVSSHALDQKRADGIPFASAAFTNLTRDHLDYHGNIEAYFQAKRRLFTELCAGVCTINVDDAHGRRLHSELIREGRVTFSFSAASFGADLCVSDLHLDVSGISAILHTPAGDAPFKSPLVGRHNVENILTAAGLVLGAGFSLDDIIRGIESLDRIRGRLDRVPSQTRSVFVDYAHTDDALTHVLDALRPLTKNKLICVFGCGGDRDHGKRPMMGRAAAAGADLVIVTNDNPRSESPEEIASAILEGIRGSGMDVVEPEALKSSGRACSVVLSRSDAIRLALQTAESGDVVLIAGKGHENYQLIGNQKLNFDDRAEVEKCLAELERKQ